MNCPSCGRSVDQGHRFCDSCGYDTQGQVPAGQSLSQAPRPESKKNNTLLFVIILVVVVVVVVGMVAAMAMSNVSNIPNKGNIGIVVHSGTVSYDGFILTAGYKDVIYNVTVTNNMSSNMDFWVQSFELHTSSGGIYTPSYSAGTTLYGVPQSLSPGGSFSLTLAYEIPGSDSGVKIVYGVLFEHGSASVPL